MGRRAQKDCPAGFEKVRNVRNSSGKELQGSLGAENSTRLTAKKKVRSSVIQLHKTELCQQPHECGRGP